MTTVLATLVGLACALLFSTTPAFASTGHGLTGSFGSKGSGTGQFSNPVGVAVNDSPKSLTNPAGEDVYVVDKGNDRVERFSSAGVYEGQFNAGGTYEDVEESVKVKTGAKAPTGTFEDPEWIAIDNDDSSPSFGDVYVTDNGYKVVDKFTAFGTYLCQLRGPDRRCLKEEGEETKVEKEAPTFGASGFAELEGVAVDIGGQVWVDRNGNGEEKGEIDAFSGAEPNVFLSSRQSQALSPLGENETSPGLAVDSEDNLYIVYAKGSGYVAKLNGTGEVLDTLPVNGMVGVAVDLSNNDVYMDRYLGAEPPHAISVFDPVGAEIERFGEDDLSLGSGLGVSSAQNIVYVADATADDVDIFTEGAKPEAPHTDAPEEIAATSAKFAGTLEPSGAELDYYFEYYEGNVANCTGTGTKTIAEKGKDKVSRAVALHPSAEYTYCLVAKDTFGPEYGAPETIKTLAAKPEVISESVSNTSPEQGVFSAKINPENQETTYYFEFSTEGSVANNTLEGTVEKVAGNGSLPPGEFGGKLAESGAAELPEFRDTYYYRVVAENATGKTEGVVRAYTKLPEVISESAPEPDLTLTEATLEATVGLGYQNTHYRFEYATGEHGEELLEKGEGIQVPGSGLGVKAGDPPQPANVVLSALKPYTSYYYRVILTNYSTENPSNADKGEPVVGKIEKFTTRSLPFTTTGEAQSITRTSATLSGAVIAPFVTTTYYYEYIDQAAYQKAAAGDAPEKANPYAEGATTAPVVVQPSETPQAAGPVQADGLLPETTYVYRLVAKNKFGREYGQPGTFTTAGKVLPSVSTGGASGIGQNSATLAGTVTTNGLQTNYGFEIGTEPGNYGPVTGLGSIGGATTEAVSVTLGELQPGTTYYYRITATNADGASYGAPVAFTTPGFPVLLGAPSSLPQVATPNIAFPKEERVSPPATTKVLTNKQKLANALKACKKEKSKSRRTKCERQARSKYGAVKKAKKSKKK